MAIEVLRDVARAGVSAFAGGAAHFGNTAPDPALFPRWYLLDGTYFEWDGAAWFQPPGTPGQDGEPGAPGAAVSPILSWII